MSNLPRVRWMALVVVVAYGVTLAGVDFDFVAALQSLAMKAAGLPALLLVVAKMLEELMNSIDEEDPMVYTQGRGVEVGGFWERVL